MNQALVDKSIEIVEFQTKHEKRVKKLKKVEKEHKKHITSLEEEVKRCYAWGKDSKSFKK